MTPEKAEALPAPCHMACPAGIDIPSYLALVAQRRFAEALEVIREDNPFPWVCGLICPHPCEKACVRAHLDDPINIRYLKAFVAEWTTRRRGYPASSPPVLDGPQVAVIGSGPAGLTAAHYLALKKYRVTIFESLPEPGGLLRWGIPEFRLPRHIVQAEIESIQSLGVDMRTGVTVGRDVTLDQLRSRGYAAFFIGTGAQEGLKLEIEGRKEFPQILDAMRFLRNISEGIRAKPAERVAVVGGTSVALDTARACVRLGCTDVHLVVKRSEEQMPVPAQQLREAREEGVQCHFLSMPLRLRGEQGRIAHLECLKMGLGKADASGRRRPLPQADSNFLLSVEAVIAAVGKRPNLESFTATPFCALSPRNTVVTRPFSTHTSARDIFAGGDVVTGLGTVVEAVAAGKQAALDIDHFLSGSADPAPIFRARKRRKIDFFRLSAQEKIDSHRVPELQEDLETRRRKFSLVELGYEESMAVREAVRCLRCDVCIRCGACERVCRDHMKVNALEFKQIGSTERILSDYDRPSRTCIACGACAIACPTGAIECLESDDAREVLLCGTVLNRLEAGHCARCKKPLPPQRYLQYVVNRSDNVTGMRVEREFCSACAREQSAARFVKPA